MKRVINFIIKQEVAEIDDLINLVQPLKENFDIRNYCGQEATKELIEMVIFWEKHSEIYDSLEKILDENFFIPQTL